MNVNTTKYMFTCNKNFDIFKVFHNASLTMFRLMPFVYH